MNKKISICVLLSACFFLPAGIGGQEKSGGAKRGEKDHVSINGSDLRWEHHSSDAGTEITLAVRNARFNDDYTDLESVAPGGYFRLWEERGGISRRLEITPGEDGQLKRIYTLRGEVRPFDDAARAWLANLLSETVASSGYDAEARVRKILQKRGVSGVLAEITRLKSDYARRVYSSLLIEQGNLSGEQLAKLLSQNTAAISSDYEKATLLIKVLKNNLADTSARAAFFGMTHSISSDYERGRVLAVLFKQNDLSRETLLLALKSMHGMSSDYEKANVLIRAAKTEAADDSVRAAIIEAAHTLGSDHERGRVLTVATKKQQQ
jgi:uncharacterized protein YeeX (DUF496 family)